MRIISKTFAIAAAAASVSCSGGIGTGYQGGFDHVKEPLYGTVYLKSQTTHEPEKVLVPLRLFIAKNVLVQLNDSGEAFYNIYTLPNLYFINTLGKRSTIEGLHVSPYAGSVRVGDKGFEIFDTGSLKELIIHFGELEISGTKHISGPTKDLIGFTMLNDSLYSIIPEPELFKAGLESQFNDSELLIVNDNNGDIVRVGEFPPIMRDNKIETGVKILAVNEKLRRFAILYLMQKQLKIVDFDGNILRSVAVDLPPYLNYETMSLFNNWGNYIYYIDCYCDDNYIYALCLNEKRNNYLADTGKRNSEIHIFDWNGTLLKIAKCDRPLTCFTVSEKYGYIYACSVTYPEYLFRMPIPRLSASKETPADEELYEAEAEPIGSFQN